MADTRVNEPFIFTLRLVDGDGTPLSGKVTSDFYRKVLDAYDQDQTSMLEITEVVETPSQGRYYASITPNSAGTWKIWVQYSSGSQSLLDYNTSLVVGVGDVLPSVTGDALTDMVTRCKTHYSQLASGASEYISYHTRTDSEWAEFILDALDAFNSTPPNLTSYTIDTLPSVYRSDVKDRAILNALMADTVFEAAKHFTYSDNGISFSRDRHGKYLATWQALLSAWAQRVALLKKMMGFAAIGPKGQFSATSGYPRSLDRSLRGVRKWNR